MSVRRQLVLASGNAGKLREMGEILNALDIELVPQSSLSVSSVAETGTTFVENAIIKARHAADMTGLPAIADDSGLAVSALGGAPGIYSARYAGPAASDAENVDKLLHALTDADDRSARFWCVIVVMRHAADPTPLIASGSWPGTITQQRSGDAGFGYDPVFRPSGLSVTAAEMSRDDKNRVSHRGQALGNLKERIRAFISS